MSVEEAILNKITDNVIKDYYTAGIKTEVVIDTLITPVITDLIKEMLKDRDIINGELVYITKEFPMIKQDGSYSSTKADYLLMDKDTVYLAELKTSMDSMKDSQIDNYFSYINNIKEKVDENRNCLEIMIDEFSALLNHVSNTGKGEIDPEKPEMTLPELVERVLKRKNINVINKDFIGAAREYLKSESASSSKKFLMQAADIVENLYLKKVNYDWRKINNIKLIYIEPENKDICESNTDENTGNDDSNRIICYLDKLKCTDNNSNYYEWVKNKILKPIFK